MLFSSTKFVFEEWHNLPLKSGLTGCLLTENCFNIQTTEILVFSFLENVKTTIVLTLKVASVVLTTFSTNLFFQF